MSDTRDSCKLAIIGMAGRFPGARDVDAFWANLANGIESIGFFTEPELETSGASRSGPAFVAAGGTLDDIDLFDAGFFGFSATEANWMDPQQRVFLECCWTALEDAGCDPQTFPGAIAVYAGANANTYFMGRMDQIAGRDGAEFLQMLLGNDKDFLATRVCYKLDLRGEGVTVQSSCSTSLVALHLAAQSLLTGQSDVALAGGVSIRVPQKTGYVYDEGLISSPDGRCRPFDQRAKGTVAGNGVGVVVLRRLEDALESGDRVRAIVLGSWINNDGKLKAGYTAPSMNGQAEVIARALALAGVSAETIGFVEGHGTATPVGDPIEVQALTRAFRRQTAKTAFCALGSVKSNIGHLDTAAGAAGLIKTVLALEHQAIPPTLHFEEPNPALDLPSSPFFVNNVPLNWDHTSGARRAGVSSFGIGGTNAHVILEEAPAAVSTPSTKPGQVVTLSAKTPAALAAMREQLRTYLDKHSGVDLADLAFSRNTGRTAMPFRQCFVARDSQHLRSQLESPRFASAPPAAARNRRVVFIFPGQGSLAGAALSELDALGPVFRRSLDECDAILRGFIGSGVREERTHGSAEVALGVLLSLEYSLCAQWIAWGIQPAAMIGNSFGEYAAACVSGVFSLSDALSIAVERGRLIDRMPQGAMLAVAAPEFRIREYLTGKTALAAITAPSRCVISGPVHEIARFEQLLAASAIGCVRISVAHAFHSPMVDSSLEEMEQIVSRVLRNAPQIPYISNLTGAWIDAADAVAPSYWAKQMRQTVRFGPGLATLAAEGFDTFLEVGPNSGSMSAAREQVGSGVLALASFAAGHTGGRSLDVMNALGALWSAGSDVDWPKFFEGERRCRIPLPTYPFERQRYWIEPSATAPTPTNGVSQPLPDLARDQPVGPERFDSQRQHLDRSRITAAHATPRNEIERRVLEVWTQVIGVQGIGIQDDFIELGGDSLIAIRILGRIQQSFSVVVPINAVFLQPTISGLAQVIQEALLSPEPAAPAPAPVETYYCTFDLKIGDAEVTVHLTEQDYRNQGVPVEARNFRLCS